MAYVYGTKDVARSLNEEIKPDTDKMYDSVYKNIDGETWVKRIRDAKTEGELERIFVTESHRCFSDGQWDSANGRAKYKTWHTQEDDKVRDSHWYLDGLKVGINDYFYTITGDKTLHPLGFGVPAEDVNCRCYLEYTK